MITTAKMKNGVNVEQLEATIAAVQEDSSLAKFEFRAKNNWIEGGHCVTSVDSYYGVNQEHERETFTMEADHPEVLLGKDLAPNPAEIILHALSSCLTAAITYHAAAQDIEIEGLSSSLKGGADLRGFLGLDPEVRKGYEGIEVTFKVKSDATDEQLRNLAMFSPVFDMITNPTPVSIQFER